jgi:hypothetical protein
MHQAGVCHQVALRVQFQQQPVVPPVVWWQERQALYPMRFDHEQRW